MRNNQSNETPKFDRLFYQESKYWHGSDVIRILMYGLHIMSQTNFELKITLSIDRVNEVAFKYRKRTRIQPREYFLKVSMTPYGNSWNRDWLFTHLRRHHPQGTYVRMFIDWIFSNEYEPPDDLKAKIKLDYIEIDNSDFFVFTPHCWALVGACESVASLFGGIKIYDNIPHYKILNNKNIQDFFDNKVDKMKEVLYSQRRLVQQSQLIRMFIPVMNRVVKKRHDIDLKKYVNGELESEYSKALRAVKMIKRFEKLDHKIEKQIDELLSL